MNIASSTRTTRCALTLCLCLPTIVFGQAASQHPSNPYRANPEAIAAGAVAYAAHCAQCHGQGEDQANPEAPDLRRLSSFCRRLKEPGLKDHCLSDVDTYFLVSVREGKVRAGVVHMPPWKDQLSVATMWAIRSYTESLPLPPPRTLTTVDRAAGKQEKTRR